MEKIKVLIVEDEWIIANDIKNNLLDFGYLVTAVAASGRDALEEIDREPPDLVLMDIILPGGMNGIEAAKAIRTEHDIPVICLTAYDDQYLMENADSTDHSGYILKPFKYKDLHAAIELALSKSEKGGR